MSAVNELPNLTRRAALLSLMGGVGGLMLTACSAGSTSSQSTAAKRNHKPRWLAPFFATGEEQDPVLRTGLPQRLPFGLADEDGAPLSKVPASLAFTLSRQGKPIGPPIVVARFGDGTPFPYFPLRVTFAAADSYSVSTDIDGVTLQRTVIVATPDAVALVQRGERAIPIATPTTGNARGVDPICTRDPPCPFHALSLADALVSGQPTAFLISTPAFCQTNVCGPVLELLIDAAPQRPTIQIVHAEVYADIAKIGDISKAKLSEAVTAYRLSFEPSLLVVDATGIVRDRLDFVWDRAELDEALDLVAPKR